MLGVVDVGARVQRDRRWLPALVATVLVACGPVDGAGDGDAGGTAGSSPTATASPSPSPSQAPSPSPSTPPSLRGPVGHDANPDAQGPAGASPRGDDAPVVLRGRVVGVVDGDTLDLADGTRVRIALVDTPEVAGGAERCGPEAAAFTAAFVADRTVALHRPVSGPATDPFGRTLGEVVRVQDGASLNVALVAAGLGVVDERFADEDPDLARRARAAARDAAVPPCADGAAAGDGPATADVVIARVREDGPGDDVEVYGDSEFVELRNDGNSDVDVSGWTIVDAAGNGVTIGRGFTVRAGGTFRVYSGDGDDVPDAAWFAGLRQAYLNNSGGDELRLLDAGGAIVSSFRY